MYVIVFIFVVAAYIYVFIKTKYSHWSRKGVKGPPPLPIVGNFGRLMLQQQTITQLGETFYKQFPEERVVGLYCGFTPVLLLRDPVLVNQIMTSDFNNFVNRGVRTAEEGFSNNILISEDDTWRITRQKMSSAFTGTKLKQMVPLIHECVNKLIRQIDMSIDSQANFDIKKLAAMYSLDLVCSCGFGLSLDFNSDVIEQFRKMGQQIITPSTYFRLWYAAEMIIPGIQRMLPAVDPARHIRNFFINLVSHVIGERKRTKEKRHDFMDIMIKLHEQDKSLIDSNKPSSDMIVDVNFIASQAFVFYSAGFETSSATLALLLYELALHDDYQNTVYEEICTVLDKYDGEITYESINEMNYLEKVLNETLRKHPVVGFILRKAHNDYTFPDTNIHVKAGTLIIVSPGGLHYNTKYYDDPETFNPETCSPENLKRNPPSAFIPFGTGPRNCVGLRFARLHIMIAAVSILRRYKVSPCTRTDKQKKVEFDSISITMTPVDGVWIQMTKRN